MQPIDMKPFAARATLLLKLMGNEHRLMVLSHLSAGEKSVGELEALVGLTQSALSQHLARLRRDGLVRTRRDRQTIYYSLNGKEAETVMRTLLGLYGTAKPFGDGSAVELSQGRLA